MQRNDKGNEAPMDEYGEWVDVDAEKFSELKKTLEDFYKTELTDNQIIEIALRTALEYSTPEDFKEYLKNKYRSMH